MKMRTARTAGLVGGLATGALLLAGGAAQAADTGAEESATDLVQATPEALGGLPVSPDAVTGIAGGVTSKVPGLNAIPVDAIPGLDAVVPAGPSAEAKPEAPVGQVADQVKGQTGQEKPADVGNPLTDLLSDLGGGLPVPLPF
ncbi:hypothetical protein AB0B28_16495 [Glycomyces sp. NPDC046736]|uniref:hypothetical protein n=1 Tax=Glycomyces sp. NPDC046736 TaxID=3155615 RepID=UPI003407E949